MFIIFSWVIKYNMLRIARPTLHATYGTCTNYNIPSKLVTLTVSHRCGLDRLVWCVMVSPLGVYMPTQYCYRGYCELDQYYPPTPFVL